MQPSVRRRAAGASRAASAGGGAGAASGTGAAAGGAGALGTELRDDELLRFGRRDGDMVEVAVRPGEILHTLAMFPGDDATQREHASQMTTAIESGQITDINAYSLQGLTALHMAAISGNIHAALVLLNCEAIEVNAASRAPTRPGLTPLHIAASTGNFEMVDLLLGTGADPNCRDEDGKTALHYAAASKHPAIVSLLLEAGADIDAVDNGNITPLQQLAFLKSDEAMPAVIELPIFSQRGRQRSNINPTTALTADAKRRNTYEIAKTLVRWGANLEVIDRSGYRPLCTAAERGNVEVINALTDGLLREPTCCERISAFFFGKSRPGAEVTATTGGTRRTALHAAAFSGHVPGAERLIAVGANVNAGDQNGFTPLDYAVRGGHAEMIAFLQSRGGIQNAVRVAVVFLGARPAAGVIPNNNTHADYSAAAAAA